MKSSSRGILTAALTILWIGGSGCAAQENVAGDAQASAAPEQIRSLIREGQHAEAESLARQLLVTVEAEHGAGSVDAARVLDLLVECLWRAGKSTDPDARRLAERAVAIKESELGDGHLETTASLRNLAVVLEYTGETKSAIDLYDRVLEIRERQLGPHDPEVAVALIDLGNLFLSTDRHARAGPPYERALVIQRRAFGDDHPVIALTLTNLAILHTERGDYEAAQPLLEWALEIREKQGNPLDIAWTANSLAVLLEDLGDYDRAMSLYERALALREEALGRDHLHVGWVLNNLGWLHRSMGDYVRARSAYERALRIEESERGPNHPDVAMTLANLAELFHSMGDYTRAREFYERALAIREVAMERERNEVAGSLCRLANVFTDMGEYARAREMYERALAIWESIRGTNHCDYARGLEGLAHLSASTGDRHAASSLHSQALTIRENARGEDHPLVANSLCRVAELLLETERVAEAELLYRRALRIREQSLGPGHPQTAVVLGTLSGLWIGTGDRAEALDAALRAEEIGIEHLELTSRTLPERQALHYAAVRPTGLDAALSLAASGLDLPSLRRVWDSLIRSRALVLDEMAARRRSTARVADPEVDRLSGELTSSSRRLANLVMKGPDPNHPERYRSLVEKALEEKEEAERALAKANSTFRRERERSGVNLAQIAARRPPHTALVAFALYEHHAASGEGRTVSSRSYLALVLPSGRSNPVAVPLGSAVELDRLVADWRAQVVSGPGQDDRSTESEIPPHVATGETLRRKVWDPVAAAMGGAAQVFLVPDGTLHLVSFGALPSGNDSYLVESGPAIHYLSAERDLVVPQAEGRRGAGLLAMGGPDFESSVPGGESSSRTGPEPSAERREPIHGPRSSCADFSSLRFASLPASAAEVKEIVSLWKEAMSLQETGGISAVLLSGSAAGEAAFMEQAPGKRIVHVATHGFFLGDRCPSALGGARGIGGLSSLREKTSPPLLGESPLLLSGLALAGANRRGGGSPDAADGILTAQEIASMDLAGLEWAVLSACDTGGPSRTRPLASG